MVDSISTDHEVEEMTQNGFDMLQTKGVDNEKNTDWQTDIDEDNKYL